MDREMRLAILNDSDAQCPCGAAMPDDLADNPGWFVDIVSGEAVVRCPECR